MILLNMFSMPLSSSRPVLCKSDLFLSPILLAYLFIRIILSLLLLNVLTHLLCLRVLIFCLPLDTFCWWFPVEFFQATCFHFQNFNLTFSVFHVFVESTVFIFCIVSYISLSYLYPLFIHSFIQEIMFSFMLFNITLIILNYSFMILHHFSYWNILLLNQYFWEKTFSCFLTWLVLQCFGL